MESKQKAVRPLTPDLMGEKYPRPNFDFSKHIPWLKGFKTYQPPADQKILIHQEDKK